MRKNLSAIILAFSLFSFPVFAQNKQCVCISASKNDVPTSGNMTALFNEGKVKRIKGKIFSTSDLDDRVAEVFKVSKDEFKDDSDFVIKLTENKKRKKACKVKRDGVFCFDKLSNGFYILKVGVNRLKRTNVNTAYFLVEINKNGIEKEIEAYVSVPI